MDKTSETKLEISTDIEGIVESCNHFTLKLYKNMSRESENFFISPISIFFALSMFYVGANNKTLENMQMVLEIQDDKQKVQESVLGIMSSLIADMQKDGYDLNIANLLGIKSDFPVLPKYLEIIQNYFLGDILNPPSLNSIIDQVNAWVSQKTHGKISEIVEELSDSMVMLVVNAVYFKGKWVHQFHNHMTRNRWDDN